MEAMLPRPHGREHGTGGTTERSKTDAEDHPMLVEKVQCGWLKDKYGLSWQVVPTILSDMMSDPDPERSERVVRAMLEMKKIDIRALRQAYEG
jgi:predicted 3-demethylubiquinone-9 3-methyltransferase (glyoxalase superfamily)